MKVMLSKAFDTKQTTQTFLVNIKKIILRKIDDLTVFEPKHSLEGWYDGTDALPLSQTEMFQVGFKGQSHMFELSIFSTQK